MVQKRNWKKEAEGVVWQLAGKQSMKHDMDEWSSGEATSAVKKQKHDYQAISNPALSFVHPPLDSW